jgi:hypothetical protein
MLKEIRNARKNSVLDCIDFAHFRDIWEETISEIANSDRFTKQEIVDIAKQLLVHIKRLPSIEEFYE